MIFIDEILNCFQSSYSTLQSLEIASALQVIKTEHKFAICTATSNGWCKYLIFLFMGNE